jgi:endonuclease YncB( thermonuclease family)
VGLVCASKKYLLNIDFIKKLILFYILILLIINTMSNMGCNSSLSLSLSLDSTQEFDITNIDINNIDFFGIKNMTFRAYVIDCYDGDTITCLINFRGKIYKQKIRMFGYDAPEMRPSTKILPDQRTIIKAKAVESKKYLESLIKNKWVHLEIPNSKEHNEKYNGRELGIIKLNKDDEKTINNIMIENGHGYTYLGGAKK